jgi:hypothetical protein
MEGFPMSKTFKIADFLVTAKDALKPEEEEAIVYGVCKARAFVDKAFLQTIEALQVETKCAHRQEAAAHLAPDFVIHVEANFRTHGANDLFQVLHRLQGLLLKLSGCLRSPDLHFQQYGLEFFEPKSSTGAAPRGYVGQTFSERVQLASSILQGGEGKCLNIDHATYKNDSKIYLDFEQLKTHNLEGATDTIIHESTHKFLASLDNTLDCPWKHAAEYYRQWRQLNTDPPINEAWRSLSTEEALQNAYGLTNYIHYMPDVDIAAFHQREVMADGSFGGFGNRTVFESVGNADL